MTVHNLEVRLHCVHLLNYVQKIMQSFYTMSTTPPRKNDLTPPPVAKYSRGIPQNFFQDFVCCLCGKDATLSHGQTDSLYCVEHHPDWQKIKERK